MEALIVICTAKPPADGDDHEEPKLALGRGAALATSATALAPAGATPLYVYEMCDSVLPGGGVDGVVYGAHPRGLFSSENTCGQPGGALILRQNEIAERRRRGDELGGADLDPGGRDARIDHGNGERLRGNRTLDLVDRLDDAGDELADAQLRRRRARSFAPPAISRRSSSN